MLAVNFFWVLSGQCGRHAVGVGFCLLRRDARLEVAEGFKQLLGIGAVSERVAANGLLLHDGDEEIGGDEHEGSGKLRRRLRR